MPRFLFSALAMAAPFVATSALAADSYQNFGPLRPTYPTSWENAEANPLRFEAGLRYWYALGEQTIETGGQTYSADDRSHILEGHFRIDDDYTSSFVKGQAGYAIATDGEYTSSALSGESEFSGGQIGYAGADFGWTPLGNDNIRVGGLVGYQFLRESPDRNRLDVAHIDGLNIHAMRLGVTAHADLNDWVDFDLEGVIIPYAYASGSTAEVPSDDRIVQGVTVNRSRTDLSGALYGASGQAMLGFHPTENLTLRIGGRAWLLTGSTSATTRQWEASTPDTYLYDSDEVGDLTLIRYGALAELTGRF